MRLNTDLAKEREGGLDEEHHCHGLSQARARNFRCAVLVACLALQNSECHEIQRYAGASMRSRNRILSREACCVASAAHDGESVSHQHAERGSNEAAGLRNIPSSSFVPASTEANRGTGKQTCTGFRV